MNDYWFCSFDFRTWWMVREVSEEKAWEVLVSPPYFRVRREQLTPEEAKQWYHLEAVVPAGQPGVIAHFTLLHPESDHVRIAGRLILPP